jgi:protein involved in polysaccharide export with SLBB domain
MAFFSGAQQVTKNFYSTLALFIAVLFFNQLAQAQGLVNSGAKGRAAQYFLGSQDQVLMAVNVWGFVNMPGQYMVPLETDLVSLLSYAGGPREDARIKRIRVVRTSAEADTSLVINVDVKNFVTSGDLDENPLLLPGDTVVVSGTTFYLVSKMFELGFRIAMIVQAVYLAQWYSTRD